jgi:hypothetical protein
LPANLPDAPRFFEATYAVGAMHLLLPAESRGLLPAHWQATLQGSWVSPFSVQLPGPEDPVILRKRRAAAHLTADYIYRRWGLRALLELARQAPGRAGWDQLFQAALQRPTVSLDNEALLYSQSGFQVLSNVWRHEQVTPADFPLATTLQQVLEGRLRVTSAGQANPLLVELPADLALTTPAGLALPSACLPPGSRLAIDGTWLEQQRRLLAARVTVEQIPPLPLAPAPSTVVAYLVGGALYEVERAESAGAVYSGPLSASGSLAFGVKQPILAQALLALTTNGLLQRLTVLSPTLTVAPLPVEAGGWPHFLLKQDLPGCAGSWFFHYQPEQGVTGQWFSPPGLKQWLWRADRQTPLFFVEAEQQPGYHIYGAGPGLTLSPLGRTNAAFELLGWHSLAGQVVVRESALGESFVGLLDWERGMIKRQAPAYYQFLRSPELSPDGRWLAHMAGMETLSEASTRLDVLEVAAGREQTLLALPPGYGLDSIRWSPHLSRPRLAVLVGPIGEEGKIFRATQLLLVDPNQPSRPTLLAEAAAGDYLSRPVICHDEAVLYLVGQAGKYRLRYQRPGQPAVTLLTTDLPFRPISCLPPPGSP